MLASFQVWAEPNSVREIEDVRANLSRTLEYRDQAAKEQAAWDLRRGQLENLIQVAEEERKNLEAAIGIARPMLEDLQSRELELSSSREESQMLADVLRVAGPRLAGRLIEGARQWPDPLLVAVESQLNGIQAILDREVATFTDPEVDTLIRSTVEALEEALKFQNGIHHSSVIKRLPDGRAVQFETIYLGLAGGFYLSEELNLAGRIVPRSGGWEWIPQDELNEPIRSFLETLQGERQATWIRLPVRIGTEEGGG
ncbi:MAG: DUF3450 family protein [Opitutaceae bacterium]